VTPSLFFFFNDNPLFSSFSDLPTTYYLNDGCKKIGTLNKNFFEKMTNFWCNFFMWVYLKPKIYFNQRNNLEDLRQRTCAEIKQISPDIINPSVQGGNECQMVGGGQFQHLH
jgi:hypothetical protein